MQVLLSLFDKDLYIVTIPEHHQHVAPISGV